MPTVTPPTITALPAPPDPANRATFNALAYPWSVAQQTFATEVGAVATNVKANADDAATSSNSAAGQVALAAAQVTLATNQATAAASSAATAGAIAWVSGTTYAVGAARFSLINFQTYRRITPGAGTTDPANDPVNWVSTTPASPGSILYLAANFGVL